MIDNPWVIELGVIIIGGILVGLILYHVFGIGKSKKGDKDIRRAGVIDEGVNTTFIDREGIGPDAGLISKGKGLKSINNTWSSRDEITGAQKQKFEENKRNYLDPRNSNK